MENPKDKAALKLTAQLREQVNQLSAAVQLLTPLVREHGGTRYGPYLAIANQNLYRLMRTICHMEYVDLQEADVRRQPVDLSLLCRCTAEQTAGLAELAGVKFSWQVPEKPIILCGDGALVQRLLLTLISNALHWAGRNGQAGLRLTEGQGRAAVAVWDSGPGLQAADGADSLHHLLDPASGAGLGLPAARRIAALHGGTVVLEQREERGVTAVLSLPLSRPVPTGELRTPGVGYESGGFAPVLVELSDCLPPEAFLPDEIE